ncbi:hypothetical protein Asppvi_003773, partial [Aspergillus pseudoviridinutans]
MSLRAQGHENIITAARKRLYGQNRWWVVDVYVEDRSEQSDTQSLHSRLVRSLREHFPNQRQPPDGLIYERLRFYEGHLGSPPDHDAASAWWAILQHNPKSKKHKYLKAFFRHGSFPQAFDALLPIPGLWARMQIGVLHSLIALRCDEVRNSEQQQRKGPSNSGIITLQPVLFYLQGIRRMWVERIFGGNVTLAVHADVETVQALESRVPKVSDEDLGFLEGKMVKQTLFPSIEDPKTREDIWQRLQLIDAPILTLRTFFQDIRFLGVARKVMQTLLLPLGPWESKNKATIDEELGGHYRMAETAS